MEEEVPEHDGVMSRMETDEIPGQSPFQLYWFLS